MFSRVVWFRVDSGLIPGRDAKKTPDPVFDLIESYLQQRHHLSHLSPWSGTGQLYCRPPRWVKRGPMARARAAISPNHDPRQSMPTTDAIAIHRLQAGVVAWLKNHDGHESVAARTLTGKLARHQRKTFRIRP